MQHTPFMNISAPKPRVASDPTTLQACIDVAREVHKLDAEDIASIVRRHFNRDGYDLALDLAAIDMVGNLRIAVSNSGVRFPHLPWAPVVESVQLLVDLGASDEYILKRAAEVLR